MSTHTMWRFCLAGLAWAALSGHEGRASCVTNGYALNQSYTTQCAEVDNINVPFLCTNLTAYRVTATLPNYYPVAIDIRYPDFTNCGFADTRTLWTIGTNDGASGINEFLPSPPFPTNFYAQDNPPEGVDQASTSFPREINNDWWSDQYIRFTANESGDANTELTIGDKLTVVMAAVSGTLEMNLRTWNGSGWTDYSNQIFTTSQRTNTWSIPDFTWLSGTDSNIIHMDVVTAGEGGLSTTNAWAQYDYIELRKRDELGSTTALLYDDGKVKVEAVNIDFWWRAPQAMTIAVTGGLTNNNAHYLRIVRKEPTFDGYNEIFVLYEDGNARIIPFPPVSLASVPYGASVILGPSQDGARPYAAIDKLTIDPKDISIDIQYEGGGTAHAELYVDRNRQVVDVSGITYGTATQSFARMRSMWVIDGMSDMDRVSSEDGPFRIMDGWSSLPGTWWQFYKEAPSYHNTYCPDFRVEVIEPSQAFLTMQAESPVTGINYAVVSRSGAAGGSSLAFPGSGGEATYAFTLAQLRPETTLIIRYADTDGGDNGTNLGNRIEAYIDGALTNGTWSANTGGSNSFELTPALRLGDLAPGSHTLRVTAGPGTSGVEFDQLALVSQPEAYWTTNSILTRQAESADGGSGFTLTNRPSAVGGTTLVMSASGGTANYNISLASFKTGVYLRLRHSDDWNPTKMEVSLDGQLRARTPSMTEGEIRVDNASFELGPAGGGSPSSWFKGGDAGQESWAPETGTNGMAFYGWVTNGSGYFGEEVNVTSAYGNVFSFIIRGNREANFVSTTGVMRLKLEFWVRGEASARSVVTNNVYAQFSATPNAWLIARVRATNTVPEVNLLKVVVDFAGGRGKGAFSGSLAMKWDNGNVFQGLGTGVDYFENAGILDLGDVSSGSHTVSLAAAAETLGMDVDELELFTLLRANRAPGIGVPTPVTVPVGSSTSFVVTVSESDPDCVDLSNTAAPSGSTFSANTFAWTPGASDAGTTSTVAFMANDQRGDTNSVVTSNVIVVVPFDWDGDGMGDGWEWSSFLTLTNQPDGDPDGDGMQNGQEYIAGTAPTNGASFFNVITQAITGVRQITVPTQPARHYTIDFADGPVSNGMAWSGFANTNIGVGTWTETNTSSTTYTFVDDKGPSTSGGESASGVRSYRVRVELP